MQDHKDASDLHDYLSKEDGENSHHHYWASKHHSDIYRQEFENKNRSKEDLKEEHQGNPKYKKDDDKKKAFKASEKESIGHTQSGKPIYNDFGHQKHKEFTSQDHLDAAELHNNRESYSHHFDNGKDMVDHFSQRTKHLHAANKDFYDKKIGTTKSGKTIHNQANHPNHKDFTAADHKDAKELNHKLEEKEGWYSEHLHHRMNKFEHEKFENKKKSEEYEKSKQSKSPIIGTTKSGKTIYRNFNHPSHKNFSEEDHRNA